MLGVLVVNAREEKFKFVRGLGPILEYRIKVTSNHLITPKQAMPITHLASASINPHVPSFHIQGGKKGNAKEVWERLAASRRSQGANIFQGEASRRHQGQVKARWPPSKAAPNYQEEGSSPG